MRTLVVLPTYNEAENIEDVIVRVRSAVPDASILVVDDSSPDGTAEIVEELAGRLEGISVLRRPQKSGLGPAYRAGFAHGREQGFEVLVEMDSDLSHDPNDLPRLLAAVADGADLSLGSRYVPGGSIPDWPWYRRALSIGGNRFAAIVLGIHVTDSTSGFRAYREGAFTLIGIEDVTADGYGFQIEMTYRLLQAGGQVTEVPISFTDRVRGESKMSWRIIGEAARLVLRWGFRDRVVGPLRRLKPGA
jgi:dolichol-phosphate mannosyltransferase